MLHWFKVSNYRSIRDEVMLDFRVPGTTPERPWLRRPTARPGLRVPTVVALIGPNGSGKSACLRALADTLRFAAQSFDDGPGSLGAFIAFAGEDTMRKPTRVELGFDAPWPLSGPDEPERELRYTLELRRDRRDVDPGAVGYEALHDFPKGRPRRLMERRGDRPAYVAKDMGTRPNDDRLASIPPDASVLSTLSRLRVETFSAIVDHFNRVETNVTAVEPMRLSDREVTAYYRKAPGARKRISDRLARFDLGIESMNVVQVGNGNWYLAFAHSGLEMPVTLEGESAGTRQVVQIFPALDSALETGRVAVMDALDNDLHADLVDEILGWFRRGDTNPRNAQLICSLHGLSALDDLEKEEVFIVEKDREGATQAYGVRDVAGVRRSADLRKLYRGGALGGLPSFG